MNKNHFILLFSLIFLFVWSSLFVKQKSYEMAMDTKIRLDEALLTSVNSAASTLSEAYTAKGNSALKQASDTFFQSLYVCLETEGDKVKEQELNLYIPAVVMVDMDGFYICFLEQVSSVDGPILQHVWSECQPYYYEDAAFLYRFGLDDVVYTVEKETGMLLQTSYEEVMSDSMLQTYYAAGDVFATAESYREKKLYAIRTSITESLSEILVSHNGIAGQYGLDIWFRMPDFLQTFTPAMEQPSILAVFQGWPLSADGTLLYNNCANASSYIKKEQRYLLELPAQTGNSAFSVFHKGTCTYAGTYGLLQSFEVTKGDAVSEYGAYACPHCFQYWEAVPLLP